MADRTLDQVPASATAQRDGAAAIERAFARARDRGRAALMPYLMGGFPDQQTATAVARAYAKSGADLIELGVPFSDPLADGPVIHRAATAALDAGATLDSVLETCAAVSHEVAVVVMCYSNMLLGDPAAFAERLAEAAAAGAIVPDLPLEEIPPVRAALDERALALVPLVAPTTPPERRRAICQAARGFVYLVSTPGTTGERELLPAELTDLVKATKADSEVPVAVGFGISTPQQAGAVGAVADGVIIGSRLVRAAGEAGSAERAAAAVGEFLAASIEAISR